MSLRTVLGAAGAVVGAFFGNPQLGYMIGSSVGALIAPGTIKGPSIGEIAQQTAQEGVPRPIVFAISPPMQGNIIDQGPPVIVKKKSSGKGGPKVVTESVFRTYAVRVCEGPIRGFVRVWRNSVLVYDAREDGDLTAEDNAAFLELARFFLGGFDQVASTDLETLHGVGLTPAYRGTAYMVMADEDLTDLRGAIPQWTFQVSASDDFELRSDLPGVVRIRYAGADRTVGQETLATGIGATFTPPPGVDFVRLLLVGGGGDGGVVGGQGSGAAAGGGGGGEVVEYPKLAVSGAQTVYVGSSSNPHEAGSSTAKERTTSFGSHSARGGGYFGSGSGTAAKFNQGGQGYKYSTFDAPEFTLLPPAAVAGGTAGGLATANSPSSGVGRAAGGGGGGAGAPGLDGVYDAKAGDGGAGVDCSAFGTDIGEGGFFGGGGGGGISPDAVTSFGSLRGDGGLGGGGRGSVSSLATIAWGSTATEGNWSGKAKSGGGGGGGQLGFSTAGIGGTGYAVVMYYDPAYWGAGFWPTGIDARIVIETICARAGVPSELLDTSELAGVTFNGIAITNQYPVAEVLRTLGQIYKFDVVSQDGLLVFKLRGGNSVATITEDDMVDDEADVSDPVNRLDAISVPRVLNLQYQDIDGGLAPDKQTSTRAGDRRSVGEASIQTPVLLTADEAAQAVVVNHKILAENQKGTRTFSLPDKWIWLNCADPIIVQVDGTSRRMLITRRQVFDGFQTYECSFDRQSAYTSEVEGIPAAPQTPPPSSIVGPTQVVPLDIPILSDTDDVIGLSYYIAVIGATAAWGGALVEISTDGGVTYPDSVTVINSSIAGTLVTTLADHPQDYPDEVHSFAVALTSFDPDLDSTTLAGMLNRTNLAIIGSPALGWEMINFTQATELDPDLQRWLIDGILLRGRKGTATRQHEIGETFILLDRSILGFVAAAVSNLAQTFRFRATSLGAPTDTATTEDMTYEGNSQKERMPAYLDVRQDGTDYHVSWQGVGRLGGGASASHGAQFTGYRITVRDATSSITIASLTQSQVIDGAALEGDVFIGVCQMNALTGPGPTAWWPSDPAGDVTSNEYLWQLGMTHPFIDSLMLGRQLFDDEDPAYYVDLLYQPGAGADLAIRKFPIDAADIGDQSGSSALSELVLGFAQSTAHPGMVYVVTLDSPGGEGVVRKLDVAGMVVGDILGSIQETQRGYFYQGLQIKGGELYAGNSGGYIDVLSLDDLSLIRTLPLTAAAPFRFIEGVDASAPTAIWIGDNIYGASEGQLHRVNKTTGVIDKTIDTRRWPMGGLIYGGYIYVYCLNNAMGAPAPSGIGVFKYQISDGAEIDAWINADDTATYGQQFSVWASGQYLAAAWGTGHKVFDVVTETFVSAPPA